MLPSVLAACPLRFDCRACRTLAGPCGDCSEIRLWQAVATLKAQQDSRGRMPLDTGEIADAVRYARSVGVPGARIAWLVRQEVARFRSGPHKASTPAMLMCRDCLMVKPADQCAWGRGKRLTLCKACNAARNRAYRRSKRGRRPSRSRPGSQNVTVGKNT